MRFVNMERIGAEKPGVLDAQGNPDLSRVCAGSVRRVSWPICRASTPRPCRWCRQSAPWRARGQVANPSASVLELSDHAPRSGWTARLLLSL